MDKEENKEEGKVERVGGKMAGLGIHTSVFRANH